MDLGLPRVKGHYYVLKTLGIQRYLVSHLILLGNHTGFRDCFDVLAFYFY